MGMSLGMPAARSTRLLAVFPPTLINHQCPVIGRIPPMRTVITQTFMSHSTVR